MTLKLWLSFSLKTGWLTPSLQLTEPTGLKAKGAHHAYDG